jgi:exodeoxyribonuclease V alpha subunit
VTERTIEGTIERVTFENASTGFRVLKVRTEDQALVPVIGTFPPVHVGARVRVRGHMELSRQHGEQLVASSVIEVAQNTTEGLIKYLSSGAIRGVGAVTAKRIVAAFGLDTMKVLDEEPERLCEVPGLGKKKAARVAKAWAEQKGMREIMVFLQAHGATPALAARIFKRYGADAANVVSREPFRLAREVWGIGFSTADRIAQGLGIAKDAPERIQAGLLQALNDAVDDGHAFLDPKTLLENASALLSVGQFDRIEHALNGLVMSGDVVKEAGAIFRPDLHRAETNVARILSAMTHAKSSQLPSFERAIARFEEHTGAKLAEAQRLAVKTAAEKRVLVVTGGPGTGKTTVVRAVLALFDAAHLPVRLSAPTGRAAKRMTEATGRDACTLHRLLEIDPRLGAFRRDASRPIEAGAVIIDEVSMVDLPMAEALLCAIGKDTRLVLVGDVDQLPSVGPGAFLRDVIASGAVPCVRLSHVFRQAETSLIVRNAHRINAGQEPQTSGPDGDFFLLERGDAESAKATVLELVTRRIPKAFGLDPVRDVQVLVPMHRGDAGASALNAALQQALNPPRGLELRRGTRVFRPGDKVMQLRNDYVKDVFNGDLGVVSHVDPEGIVLARFDEGREIEYEGSDLDDLALSYACTVHKSQGSEYPAVVVVLLTSHFVMLTRNLLYTAVTRGKRLVVIVGQRRALQVAVKEDRRGERKSRLADRLRSLGECFAGR